MARHEPVFVPRLMQTIAAAHYLGMSPSKLRVLQIPRKIDGGNVLYERADLDAYADKLAYHKSSHGAEQQCDEIFGAEFD